MAKILIQTQTYENYGYRWKPKGGSDYFITNFQGDYTQLIAEVMAVKSSIECDNDMFKEQIINYELVPDDCMTQFEQDQLEHEGFIRFPAKIIESK